MLKKRVIATLVVRSGLVVQSINFREYLPVGRPEIAVEYLNRWGIDEIIVLDITASKNKARKSYELVERCTKFCFVPLTLGGGIDSLNDIHGLIRLGADKVCINSHALREPEFIRRAADVFGSQCIVVSVDVVSVADGGYRVYDAASDTVMAADPLAWCARVQSEGAGEIYLTSVDRDGSKRGYDLDLIDKVVRSVDIPVIASGGAGRPEHILQVLSETKASAASAANFFHYYEHSVIASKAVLHSRAVPIRLNTHATYTNSSFDDDGRLGKLPDEMLQELLYTKIVTETI